MLCKLSYLRFKLIIAFQSGAANKRVIGTINQSVNQKSIYQLFRQYLQSQINKVQRYQLLRVSDEINR